MPEEFVVLDFETANAQRVSACSVGGCVISNGDIVDRFATLIKPPTDDFAPINVRIHHITPDMVADAPTFEDLFPKFLSRVQGRTVLAYSKFDRSVINALLDYVGEYCDYEYVDVCSMAKERMPGLKNHKLPTVAKALGLGSFDHHNAAADAEMCAKVFLALSGQAPAQTSGIRSVADSFSDFIDAILEDDVVDYKEAMELRAFLESLPHHELIGEILVAVDEFLEDGVIDEAESKWLAESLRIIQPALDELLSAPVQQCPQVSADPVAGKRIVIDGALERFDFNAAKRLLRSRGATYQENVTKQTDILVYCDSRKHHDPPGYKSTRLRLAERYVSQGLPIQILNEPEFYALLETVGAECGGIANATPPGTASTSNKLNQAK